MLGIFLIYFIWKKFADLASLFNKHRWGYGILGVVSYYTGAIFAGILFVIGLELFSNTSIDDVNEHALSFGSMPFGLLACWAVYKLLERRWKNKNSKKPDNYEILDDGLFS